jgi:squalene-associated FAD-dependent desaturase
MGANNSSRNRTSVAIVGGGLAGLAAGCALAQSGLPVTLFERRPYLGGRASSYQHPGTGETVDNCQHVLLGCCTNLIDLYRRTGVEDKIRWYDELTFLEPGGRASRISPSALPAPFHTAPSFLRAHCLSAADKLAISRAMIALAPAQPADSAKTFLDWLKSHGQTGGAIERFWKTILVSALNEDLDRVSVPYAAQVVRESFLKSAAGGRMGIPTVPLSELYNAAGEYIRKRGGEIMLRSTVESIEADSSRPRIKVNSAVRDFDYLMLAVSFDAISRVLPQGANRPDFEASLAHFSSSPITGIHLWFDREISDLDHAVLLDRTIQWMFHKSRIIAARRQGGAAQTDGSYVELVVSCSRSLVEKSKNEIVDLALGEVREFFPAARNANLLKSTVIKEIHATYSPVPGIDAYRSRPESLWPRVFLAGDWIRTGWPATMEGAVRGGYLAAQALLRASGTQANFQEADFMVSNLPATGFMRLFR